MVWGRRWYCAKSEVLLTSTKVCLLYSLIKNVDNKKFAATLWVSAMIEREQLQQLQPGIHGSVRCWWIGPMLLGRSNAVVADASSSTKLLWFQSCADISQCRLHAWVACPIACGSIAQKRQKTVHEHSAEEHTAACEPFSCHLLRGPEVRSRKSYCTFACLNM